MFVVVTCACLLVVCFSSPSPSSSSVFSCVHFCWRRSLGVVTPPQYDIFRIPQNDIFTVARRAEEWMFFFHRDREKSRAFHTYVLPSIHAFYPTSRSAASNVGYVCFIGGVSAWPRAPLSAPFMLSASSPLRYADLCCAEDTTSAGPGFGD